MPDSGILSQMNIWKLFIIHDLLFHENKVYYSNCTRERSVSGIGLILWNSVVISIRDPFRGLIPGFRESKGPWPDATGARLSSPKQPNRRKGNLS